MSRAFIERTVTLLLGTGLYITGYKLKIAALEALAPAVIGWALPHIADRTKTTKKGGTK